MFSVQNIMHNESQSCQEFWFTSCSLSVVCQHYVQIYILTVSHNQCMWHLKRISDAWDQNIKQIEVYCETERHLAVLILPQALFLRLRWDCSARLSWNICTQTIAAGKKRELSEWHTFKQTFPKSPGASLQRAYTQIWRPSMLKSRPTFIYSFCMYCKYLKI